jgi:hypothetical protein
MAEKGPESGNNNAAMGLAEATPETSPVKRKTVTMIQPTLFILYLPFFVVEYGRVRISFFLFPSSSFSIAYSRPGPMPIIVGYSYESSHRCIGTEDEIPPSFPLPKGRIPLFGKRGVGGDFGGSMSGQ